MAQPRSLLSRIDRPTVVVLVQALLFIAAIAVSIVDIGARVSSGAQLARELIIPTVAIAIGTVRARGRLVGARPILIAADLAVAVALALQVVATPDFLRPLPPPILLSVLALATVAGVAAISRPDGERGQVIRDPRQAALLLLIVVMDAVSILTTIVGQGAGSGGLRLDVTIRQVLLTLSSDAVLLVAWWWAAPWLLGLLGLTVIATLINVSLVFKQWFILDNAAIVGVLSVVAALLGPRLVTPVEAGASPASEESRGPIGRSRVATTWLIAGGLLYVPSVLLGLFPPILVDCFEGCGPSFPLAGLLTPIAVATVVVVPIAVLVIVFGPTGRSIADRSAAFVILAAAGIVLVQVGLGLLGIRPYVFLAGASAACIVVGLGAAASIVRPPWLERTGRVAALAAAAATVVWIWSGLILGPIGLPLLQAVAIAAGAVVAIGLASESARAGGPAIDSLGGSPAQ
jgi:hypothetical protein